MPTLVASVSLRRMLAAAVAAAMLFVAFAASPASARAAGPMAAAAIQPPMPGIPKGNPYWPGWDIARGVAMLPDGSGGYVLDGWGGLHPFAVGTKAAPPAATGAPYWFGWDIARGVTILPNGTGGYVVDGWGGLHPFAIGDNKLPPAPSVFTYWPGWDIVRGVAVLPDGLTGYVLDGWGGLHAFAASGAQAPSAVQTGAPYSPGIDRADDIALLPDGSGGYVIDGFGNVSDFGLGTNEPPGRPSSLTTWGTWDIARGISFLPDGTAFTLDGWGGLHGDSAPSLASSSYSYLVANPDGTPYRYNPCKAIHYVINTAGAPAGAVNDVTGALARLTNATGISFVDDGTTSETPSTLRSSYLPAIYGPRWAPVLVAWSNPITVPELAGSTIGIGGSSARAVDGVAEFVSGIVIMDSAQMQPYSAGFGLGYTQGDVILHELGHVLGLGHTVDGSQMMYSSMTTNVAELGLGDRAGLTQLGMKQGCLTVPPLRKGPAAPAGAGAGTTIFLATQDAPGSSSSVCVLHLGSSSRRAL